MTPHDQLLAANHEITAIIVAFAGLFCWLTARCYVVYRTAIHDAKGDENSNVMLLYGFVAFFIAFVAFCAICAICA